MGRKSIVISTCCVVLAVAVAALFGFIGCSNSGGGGGDNTLAGTCTDSIGSNPVVALFDATYLFEASVIGDDNVDQENNGQTSPYTPHTVATMDGSTFTITLPQGSNGDKMFLIAWDDANTDGKFELTENGVFPKKVFDQGEYPVEFVQYTAIQYQGQTYGEWAVYYYDGLTSYLLGLSIAGTSSYNLTID